MDGAYLRNTEGHQHVFFKKVLINKFLEKSQKVFPLPFTQVPKIKKK